MATIRRIFVNLLETGEQDNVSAAGAEAAAAAAAEAQPP